MSLMHNLFSGSMRLPGPLGNAMDLLQKFRQFAQNPVGNIMSMKNVNIPKDFHGTPQDLVNHLVNSGQMSKEQFDKFGQQANELQNMLPRF